MSYETTMKTYRAIYDHLKKEMKWKAVDNRVLMTIAATYAMHDKSFQYERFYSIAEAIQKQAGLFSYLKSSLRYTIAVTIDLHFEQPLEKVPELFNVYDDLINHKFKRDSFTYISAAILLTNVADATETIHQAKSIYETMRKEHPFLTSSSDYPLAVLLALEAEDAYERTESFYQKLNQNGFSRGNDLQLLSHILSLDSEKDVHELISQTTLIYDAFKEIGIRRKTTYYPITGMLALIPSAHLDIQAVRQIYDKLNKQKPFRWQKDLNFMLAASFFISEHMEESNVAEVSLFTTLEAALQVQQAILISSVVAASASSSNNGSN